MGTESGSLTSSEGPGPDEENAAYKTDAFRMQCMKVLPCSKRYVHDWTECPFAHPQEKARRRDPRVYNYTGIACPNMKKDGTCPLREHCPYAHNVFEYWLHPTRYRTQLCNDGPNCHRKICFFAHSLEELRVPVAKPFVSPESLAAASATVAAEDGARRQSGGNLHQASSPRSGIMEGSDSGLSYSSLEPSGSNGFSGKATTTTQKVSIPGPEASQQLAVVEMVAGLLRQGRLTAAQANTILQQSLAPSPPTPRESSSSDQQATSSAMLSQFLGTPARNPGRVLSRQLSNRSSSSVGSVGAPLGSSPPTGPVLELNSTRLSDPMAAFFPASAQPSTAQALSEQLARLQLVQSLSSLHEHQQQLAAVQAAAGWDSTRSVPPLRSNSGLDSSGGMEDYPNLALTALQQQQAAALGNVSSGQARPAVRSSGHDLVNTARLSLNANRYDDHEATLFKGLPADLRAGLSPELANVYASAFFSTQPDPTQRQSDVESGQTEAISPTNDASPSPAALWAALSSIRSLETGEISQLRRSS